MLSDQLDSSLQAAGRFRTFGSVKGLLNVQAQLAKDFLPVVALAGNPAGLCSGDANQGTDWRGSLGIIRDRFRAQGCFSCSTVQ